MASDTAQRCQGLQVSLADLDAEFERITMGFESNVAGDPDEEEFDEVVELWAAKFDALGLVANVYTAANSFAAPGAARSAAPTASVDGPGDSCLPGEYEAAVLIQAILRGYEVRTALAEAHVLYGYGGPRGSSLPHGVCIRRIYGGPRAFDFAFAHTKSLPLPFSEALANPCLSSLPRQPRKSLPTEAAVFDRGSRQPADASCTLMYPSPKSQKKQKGAGARKAVAAAALALERLRGARAAALRNKTCVTETGGELYYHGSPEADAAAGAELGLNYHDNGAPVAAGGITTLLVCWLHPGASEAEVQEIFERYGKVKEVHVDSAGMIGRSAEAPSLGRGWEYNYAMVTFFDGGEAAAAAEALNGTSITHERLANFTSESLEVNVYSRRRVCGDGGALSDDMDSDDDDDEFNSAPADDAYDDAYM